MDVDTKLRVIKYSAAGITALYGLYATVTDFHETQHGKRVLSRRGYLGIMLLVSASLLTIFSDMKKDLHDNEKDVEALKRQQEQLRNEVKVNSSLADQRRFLIDQQTSLAIQQQKLTTALTEVRQTASTTSAVLNESRRMTDPIDEITSISVTMSVPPTADAVRTYLDRLKAGGVTGSFIFGRNTPGFPDSQKHKERTLFVLSTARQVQISIDAEFHHDRQSGQTRHKGSLVLKGRCDPDYWKANWDDKSLYVECYVPHTVVVGGDGQLRSHIDLVGARIAVDVLASPLFLKLSDIEESEEYKELMELPISLDFLTLFEKSGNAMSMSGFRRGSGGTVYFVKKIEARDLKENGMYLHPLPPSWSTFQEQPTPVK